jgi:hypothetical protein
MTMYCCEHYGLSLIYMSKLELPYILYHVKPVMEAPDLGRQLKQGLYKKNLLYSLVNRGTYDLIYRVTDEYIPILRQLHY